MKTLTLTAVLTAVLSASAAFGQANTPVTVPGAPPVTAAPSTIYAAAFPSRYVKPGEPLVVRFLEAKSDEARKTFDALGLKATKVPGFFSAAAAGDVVDPAGKPLFDIYSFADKKLVAPKDGAKLDASKGELDLTAAYPDITTGGTFVLVWKNATPLVIENLKAPLPWGMLLRAPQAQRDDAIKELKSGPVNVTHIVPLEYAVIKTDAGEMKAAFYYDAAPHTVDNWISLATQGYYDGSAFHRIMKGFMLQGGDALGNTDKAGTGGPGYHINAEFNDKPHERGVLSMARSSEADSAGSQFFIMHANTDYLNGQYTGFGKLFDGLPVVDEIAGTPSEAGSGAVKGVKPKMQSVTILPATAEMYGFKK